MQSLRMQQTNSQTNASAATTAQKKELRKLAKRGLSVTVNSRLLSDGSTVYAVRLVDGDERSALMLAEMNCIDERRAEALAVDIRDSLRRNSVVQVLH